MPAQPRERIPAFIQASDICLVTLRQAPVNDVIIPFRMLEFMACARPVLLSAAGESARILKDANAGLVIPQGNPEALASAILHLRQNPAQRHQAGQNGSRYITQNFSRQQMAQTYLEVLKQAIKTPPPPHNPPAPHTPAPQTQVPQQPTPNFPPQQPLIPYPNNPKSPPHLQ